MYKIKRNYEHQEPSFSYALILSHSAGQFHWFPSIIIHDDNEPEQIGNSPMTLILPKHQSLFLTNLPKGLQLIFLFCFLPVMEELIYKKNTKIRWEAKIRGGVKEGNLDNSPSG